MHFIAIDRSSGFPVYLQIKDQIIYQIGMAKLPPGTILPSIRRLSAQLGVATATVRRAYRVLEEQGFVTPYQGKGMLVAELNTPSGPAIRESGARQKQLESLFTSTVGRAYALGASQAEIQVALARALSRWELKPRVLLVSTEPEFIDHYAPLLGEALSDLRVEVSPLLLGRQQGTAGADLHSLPLCIVTLVKSYKRVRDLFEGLAVPVVALALKLSDESRRALMDLPREAVGLLLAEQANIQGFRHQLEPFLALNEPLRLHPLETSELEQALAGADVVVHSLRARQSLSLVASPVPQRIELHFVPDPVSLDRVRQTVLERLQGATAGSWSREAELVAQ